ncbi:MAG: hypothetical protein KME25_30940 [Symplocastrum torsivum CPER-KK1]|uniref:Uncharacterized protein n=1 Tax=Symplocastrum torsivum CPER-KK1 TaxID=450513 RepID=A0A951UCT4_9CYAN|nr:hypothetical protein [Symplocastrum torsivum CPER-KK1]
MSIISTSRLCNLYSKDLKKPNSPILIHNLLRLKAADFRRIESPDSLESVRPS